MKNSIDFGESNEYYILVLENVVTLPLRMRTTLCWRIRSTFALDAQTKMEEARSLIITE